ncbi:hypothetical protein ES332_D10G148100v1 [Gossypium tomentosum]|uniref:Uncharacterized protein n=1 Tax=Gossypium tomentosum TaxID=34277 RepID=A0A5D2J3Y9_GOSTO|nr:hypothetical protein ES332_D10G148100v1 [Gossypium tomentosum]
MAARVQKRGLFGHFNLPNPDLRSKYPKSLLKLKQRNLSFPSSLIARKVLAR